MSSPKTKRILLEPGIRKKAARLIAHVVAEQCNIDPNKLRQKTRKTDEMWACQIAMYLCYICGTGSSQDVADFFNRKDHASILHAQKAIEHVLKDPSIYTTGHKLLLQCVQILSREKSLAPPLKAILGSTDGQAIEPVRVRMPWVPKVQTHFLPVLTP